MNFQNKVVVITGGTSGIGKSLVLEFGKLGAKVSFSARNLVEIDKMSLDLSSQKIPHLAQSCDVSNEAEVKKMIESTIEHFGKIDILINNAGISMRALFYDLDLSVIKKVMDANYYGSVYCTKYSLPQIIANQGSIVAISSIAGHKGLPGRCGYSSSKFAIQGFFEALRIELLKKNVHVLVACPGFTSSNIRNTALGADSKSQKESPLEETKIMSSEKVAQEIAQAIYLRKRDILLTTQGKLTVWLNKFFPSFMDKMVYNHFSKEKDSPLK